MLFFVFSGILPAENGEKAPKKIQKNIGKKIEKIIEKIIVRKTKKIKKTMEIFTKMWYN